MKSEKRSSVLMLFGAALIFVTGMAEAGTHIYVVGGKGAGNSLPWYANSSSYPQMRWQTIWRCREIGEQGPVCRIEWQAFPGYPQNGGTFTGCNILLCNTTVGSVTSSFAANYGGATPVTVFSGNYVKDTPPGGSWTTIVSPSQNDFYYTFGSNLLMEISWTGTVGGGSNYCTHATTGGPGRVYATSATAATGTVDPGYWQFGRVWITILSVAPTSLGRVKALYR